MTATVYIMRGIPGCGKTTKARDIMRIHREQKESCAIISCDEIMFARYGKFCPDKLSEVHAECFRQFCEALEESDENVIIDNTNISSWEWRRYVDVARLVGRPSIMFDIYVSSFVGIATCWERQRWQDGKRIPEDVFDRMVGRYWREPQSAPPLDLLVHSIPVG